MACAPDIRSDFLSSASGHTERGRAGCRFPQLFAHYSFRTGTIRNELQRITGESQAARFGVRAPRTWRSPSPTRRFLRSLKTAVKCRHLPAIMPPFAGFCASIFIVFCHLSLLIAYPLPPGLCSDQQKTKGLHAKIWNRMRSVKLGKPDLGGRTRTPTQLYPGRGIAHRYAADLVL